MPSYKLTYFDIKGLAEPIRFILHHAGVEFEDVRMDKDDWPKIKPSTPMGQVPMLEVDGKKMNQSTAICRYLGKQFGLGGKDAWEDLEIDATVDTINDLRIKLVAPFYEKTEEAKAAKLEAGKESAAVILPRLDAQVKRNGGYLVGGKLTWADIYFTAGLDLLNYQIGGGDFIAKYDNLKAVRDKVLAQPGIKAWVAKRPKSDY